MLTIKDYTGLLTVWLMALFLCLGLGMAMDMVLDVGLLVVTLVCPCDVHGLPKAFPFGGQRETVPGSEKKTTYSRSISEAHAHLQSV